MKDTYKLKINCDKSQIKDLEKLLEKPSTNSENLFWEWCIDDDLKPTDAFDKYLNLLDGKYDDLKKISIDRESISIWRYYTYDQECSLEISPETMVRIGQQGIVLCISCWQDH
jgi:hypothetical protein